MKHILLVFALVFLASCSSTSEEDNSSPNQEELAELYKAQNDKEIQDYIAANNLNAQKSNTGLYYVINDPGTGKQPTSTNDVTVVYKGYLTNGDVFDESASAGASFNLSNLILGWREGLTYFKEGGNGILLIPSHLAYGNNGIGSIPGGAVIIFDIDLISVN